MSESIYSNVNLSDTDVVKFLLLSRYSLDNYYNEQSNDYFDVAGVTGIVDQELMSLFASLDEIIKKLELTKRQIAILKLLECGFTFSDIGKNNSTKMRRESAVKSFNAICAKIVQENDSKWKQTVKKGLVK